MTRIYVYAENSPRAGRIASMIDDETAKMVDDAIESDDYHDADDSAGCSVNDCIAYDGSEDELIAEARKRLDIRNDKRPGGAGDAFGHKCARAIIEHLT